MHLKSTYCNYKTIAFNCIFPYALRRNFQTLRHILKIFLREILHDLYGKSSSVAIYLVISMFGVHTDNFELLDSAALIQRVFPQIPCSYGCWKG